MCLCYFWVTLDMAGQHQCYPEGQQPETELGKLGGWRGGSKAHNLEPAEVWTLAQYSGLCPPEYQPEFSTEYV